MKPCVAISFAAETKSRRRRSPRTAHGATTTRKTTEPSTFGHCALQKRKQRLRWLKVDICCSHDHRLDAIHRAPVRPPNDQDFVRNQHHVSRTLTRSLKLLRTANCELPPVVSHRSCLTSPRVAPRGILQKFSLLHMVAAQRSMPSETCSRNNLGQSDAGPLAECATCSRSTTSLPRP